MQLVKMPLYNFLFVSLPTETAVLFSRIKYIFENLFFLLKSFSNTEAIVAFLKSIMHILLPCDLIQKIDTSKSEIPK